ncbi:hypothetical protein PIB30_077362 [Stylosanthes scabra]|uniref:Aminotransferase-like plant mobile domain-containing protein n=1 Tax=Stylosanthes scabra TaxID=79078 RepID=A0ABU6YPK3_9FABA|nr:hypothetical protein [Stylosanthes scabra]
MHTHHLPLKFIGEGAIPEDKYPEFWRLIDVQGLRPFLFMREGYFPCFVAAAFTTVSVDDNLNNEGQGTFYFCVSFMGRTYKSALERIAKAWGLRNAGTTFRGGSNPHGSWNEFVRMDAARALRLDPAAVGKYHISRMTTDHRFLLYAISYMLMPRKSNHGTATEEDLILLWAMINEKQINWPYLMAHKLVNYSHGKINSALGLPHLWTKVFQMIPLDVSQDEFVASDIVFAITSKHINQMRRDLDNPNADDEGVQERNVRPRTEVGSSSQAPREVGETSQGQPKYMETLLKGFEALQARVDEGFVKLSDRIDSIDISLISQAEEIQMLRDKFLGSVDEVPMTTEPTVEVPATDVLTTDDPMAEDVMEVTLVVVDHVERDQVVAETTEVVHVVADSAEVVQEQSVEAPVQDLCVILGSLFVVIPCPCQKSLLLAEDLTLWRKLDTRCSSRMLRQHSKLEPVPEKSDNIWSYGELTRSVVVAYPDRSSTSTGLPSVGSRDVGWRPPAATISRDVNPSPTWKQRSHRHLLPPMVRCCRKPSFSPYLDPS